MVGNKNTLPTLQKNLVFWGRQQKHVVHPTKKPLHQMENTLFEFAKKVTDLVEVLSICTRSS
ncbi:MAG: hypothetical protein DRR19_30130 [Candidatus Parabeggiatoa sp. nov. 1]|nr:MAG: hypothetical protein DRR19_30130 [Gammaproteobacteria bacterium]